MNNNTEEKILIKTELRETGEPEYLTLIRESYKFNLKIGKLDTYIDSNEVKNLHEFISIYIKEITLLEQLGATIANWEDWLYDDLEKTIKLNNLLTEYIKKWK